MAPQETNGTISVTSKVIQCPELCDPSNLSWEVISYTIEWNLIVTEDVTDFHHSLYRFREYMTPEFHFGKMNNQRARIMLHIIDRQHANKISLGPKFQFLTPFKTLARQGTLTTVIRFGDNVCTKPPMKISKMRTGHGNFPTLTIPFSVYVAIYNPIQIICELKLLEKRNNKIHEKLMRKDMRALYKTMDYSDVKINVEDQTLTAHKNILAARSSVFAAMFRSDMAEAKSCTINIEDVSYNTMRELIKYMYTGTLPPRLEEFAEELMQAADKYCLDELRLECGDYLCRNVTGRNVAHLSLLGDKYCHEKLKETAAKFVKKRKMEDAVIAAVRKRMRVQESDAGSDSEPDCL